MKVSNRRATRLLYTTRYISPPNGMLTLLWTPDGMITGFVKLSMATNGNHGHCMSKGLELYFLNALQDEIIDGSNSFCDYFNHSKEKVSSVSELQLVVNPKD
jgi:hypothetical protein